MRNLHWPTRKDMRSSAAKRRRSERRLAAAIQAAGDGLVLSHGHCLDGVGSAVMVRRAHPDQRIGVAYAQPGHVADVLHRIADVPGEGRTLHVTDLSFNPGHFNKVVSGCDRLQESGWQVHWRDHHDKQWQGLDLGRLRRSLATLDVNWDQTESGASMVQQAMCPDDLFAQRLANTIRDRDLWWNKTPDSQTLEFAIQHMGPDTFLAHMIARGRDDPVVDDKVRAAAAAHQQRTRTDTQRLLRGARYYPAGPDGSAGTAAVVYGWLPRNVGLHTVLEQDDVQIAANVRPNGKMSLRSRQDVRICHKVCQEFGGGGHPNASGADLKMSGWPFWRYVLRRGKVPLVEQVAQSMVRHLTKREQEP